MGIMQFLCEQIAVELTDSRAVREDTWDELVWELRCFDDLSSTRPASVSGVNTSVHGATVVAEP